MKEIDIKQLTKKEIEQMGIKNWPVWTKGPSVFDWEYDMTEQCYILEGEFEVKTAQNTYHIKAGDFVTFPKRLKCTWRIIKPVRKHYNFI